MDNRQGEQSASNLQEELQKLQNTASMLKDALSSVNSSLVDFSKDLDNRLQQSAKSVDEEMRQLRDAVHSLRIDCSEFQRTGTQIADAIKWSMIERTKQSLALTNSFERMTDRLGVIESMFRFLPGQAMPMLNNFAYNQAAAAMMPDIRSSHFMSQAAPRPAVPGQRFANTHAPTYNTTGVPVILPPAVRSETAASYPGQLEVQDRLTRPYPDSGLSRFANYHPPPTNYMGHVMPPNATPFGLPQRVVGQKAVAHPTSSVISRGIDSEVLVNYLSLLEDRFVKVGRARLTVFPSEERIQLSADGEGSLIDSSLKTLVVTANQQTMQIGIHDGTRVFKIVVISCSALEALFAALQSFHRELSWRAPLNQGGLVLPKSRNEKLCSRCKVVVTVDGSVCNDCLSREDYSTASSELSDHLGNEESGSSEEPDDARDATRHTPRFAVAKEKMHQPLSLNASNSMPVEPLFGKFKWKPDTTTMQPDGGLFANLKIGTATTPAPGLLNQSPPAPGPAFSTSPTSATRSPKMAAPASRRSIDAPARSVKDERENSSGVRREGLTEKFSAQVANFRQGNASDSQLKDSGAGCIKIFEDELGRRRILFELGKTGKPGCNHFITTQTKLAPNANELNGCTWSALDFNDDEKGKNKQFSVQFKNKDDYDRFSAVFNRADRGAPSNKSTPESKTNKTADGSPSSGQTAPSFLFSIDKSPIASDQKKPLFGSFSFEKPPIATTTPQQEADKAPLFGQSGKSDKLLFSGKFPGAGCSLTEIVERTGKGGNLFGSSSDSKKAVFGTAVKPLFAQTSGTSVKSTADKSEADVSRGNEQKDEAEPEFEPTISMPTSVTLVTGEEGLTEKFCAKAILYRFQKDNSGGQWKERGRGTMKILEEPSGRRRVLFRRDHVHKLACNHMITPKTQLRPHNQKENCFCWFALDFSDSERGVVEQFCARFKLGADADGFAREFEIGVKGDASGTSYTSLEQNSNHAGDLTVGSADLRLLDSFDGDWSCHQCLAKNRAEVTRCVACGEIRDHEQT